MVEAFQLLADPTRRRLVELTARKEKTVTALVKSLGLTQPAVSKQLAILREAGLVSVRKDGTKRYYRARADELQEMRAWLDKYAPVWNAKLDALEEHLDDRSPCSPPYARPPQATKPRSSAPSDTRQRRCGRP